MQFVNNGLNILKKNGSIHVYMLKLKRCEKKSLIHFNVGFEIVAYVF